MEETPNSLSDDEMQTGGAASDETPGAGTDPDTKDADTDAKDADSDTRNAGDSDTDATDSGDTDTTDA